MKILVRASDNIVAMAADDLYLTTQCAGGTGWTFHKYNTGNAAVIDVAELPADFVPLAYSYADGVFTVVNAERISTTLAASRKAKAEKLKEQKQAEILADYSTATSQIKAGYDPDEMLSWPKQEEQARAYMADANASVQFLHSLAQLRGLTTQELADRIMNKVAAYEQAFAYALGTRDRRLLTLQAIDVQAGDALEQITAV